MLQMSIQNISIYFNPHSHEGSDHCQQIFNKMDDISIHTPTKGATFINPFYFHFDLISIHTPTKGATTQDETNILVEAISIHTPTKGATFAVWHISMSDINFNPHSHEGSDSTTSLLICYWMHFNPHSHEGSDRPADTMALHTE